jgi:hypothetical protein
LLVLTACAGPPVSGAGAQPEPHIRLADDGAVEITGLPDDTLAGLRESPPTPEEWRSIFPVFIGEAGAEATDPPNDRPPMLGNWSIEGGGEGSGEGSGEGGTVRFTPRFPLVPGQPYHARWAFPPGDPETEAISATLALPAREVAPSTVVAAIHPDTAEVPENLLKLYLQFSAPMSRGDAFRHVQLLDPEGEEVEAPFVAPQAELWSPDSTRLTLLFDPGRLKRGVGPHDTVGPPLRAGGTYTLVVDRELEDARGAPLRDPFRHSFRVTVADRTQPRTEDWRLDAPKRDRDALELRFPEPLDHALLHHMLRVEDPSGEPVAGEVEVLAGSRGWRFRPREPWRAGVYAVVVDTALEDLAGNSLRRPFDVETMEHEPPATERGMERLAFEVR